MFLSSSDDFRTPSTYSSFRPKRIAETSEIETFNVDKLPNALSSSSKQTNIPTISDMDDRILPTDQIVAQQDFVNPYGESTQVPNDSVEGSLTHFYKELTSKKSFRDYQNSLIPDSYMGTSSARLFSVDPLPIVLSTSASRNATHSSSYDGTAQVANYLEGPRRFKVENV
jgi:hypothetical protein